MYCDINNAVAYFQCQDYCVDSHTLLEIVVSNQLGRSCASVNMAVSLPCLMGDRCDFVTSPPLEFRQAKELIEIHMKYAHGGGERGGNYKVSYETSSATTDKSVQCVGTDYKFPPQRFSPKSCETSRDFSTHCDCDCDCDCGSPDLLNTDQSQHQNSRTRSIEQALLSLPPSTCSLSSPSDTGTQPRLPHRSISMSDDPHDEESDIKSVKSNPRKRSSAESGYSGMKRIRGSTSDDGHTTPLHISSLPSQTNDVMKQIDDLLPLLSS